MLRTLVDRFLSTPPLWLAAFVTVLVPLEVRAAARRGRRVHDHWRIMDWPAGPVGWLLAYLVGDLADSWIQRAEHRVCVLWASHQVHHSSTDFNFASTVRMPWTEVWFTPFTGLWAPFLGVPPTVAATLGVVGLMWGLLSHTSLVTSMGPLDRVFVTPAVHRVHHASNRRYLDANFGGGLVIWDRLFRTFVAETEPAVFGLTHDSVDRGPLAGARRPSGVASPPQRLR